MGADVLVWFKRDLRIADNPVLTAAAARGGRVLPLFIVEPDYWAQSDASARQYRFLAETLAGLQAGLADLGAPLVLRVGDAVTVLDRLCVRHRIGAILSHEETGNAWTFARDRRVADWARSAGIRWEEVPQTGVARRLATRDGWAARRERAMRAPCAAPPGRLRPVKEEPGAIPDARELGMPFDPCPERQRGGHPQAVALLESFLTERGRDYRRAMSSPEAGARACSRLSPHFAWGVLSPRAAWRAARARKAEMRNTRQGWNGALRSFEARLAWRDHFIQKLEDEPTLERTCLHSAYETLRPRMPDRARLGAWARGETGFPFVDACMRALIATGWMNFRMRAMLVSFASYHLWLDWRANGPHLARMFTDYEPGIHWPQMQMQSGATGMNTIRIYNPVKQGRDWDPDGAFVRRWCPELRRVPAAHMHTPWTWEEAPRLLGRGYPAPIVDLAAAAKAARERAWAVRAGPAFRGEAKAIIRRHASRKDAGPNRHFVDDRAPRKPRKRDPGQLSLDL